MMIRYENIKQIHVELSSNCNASCPNCPRNVEGGYEVPWIDKKEYTLEDFKQVFPAELIAGLHRVLFCGNYGDPVMCEATPAIVEYIHSVNPHVAVRVHTNGGMRNAEWWTRLAQAMTGPQDTTIFSIDGLEHTNHIYRRNVIWKRLHANFSTYIAAGGHATWEFLIFQHNQHQVAEAKQNAVDWGFKNFVPKKAFGFEYLGSSRPKMRVVDRKGNFEYFIGEPSDPNHQNKFMVEDEKELIDASYARTPKSYTEGFEHTRTSYATREDLFDHLDKFEIDCMAARGQEIYVDANFGVHPCCFLGHASQNITTAPDSMQYYAWLDANVGQDNINAKNSSIKDILASDYFDKIVKTWDLTHREGRIAVCSRMCAKQVNPIKNLYVKE